MWLDTFPRFIQAPQVWWFSMLLDWICHGDKSQIATLEIHDFTQMCDCRNLWRFKIQLLRLMSIVPGGTLPQKTRSHWHRTISGKFPVYIHYGHYNWSPHANRYTSEITPKIDEDATFHIHVKSEHRYSPKYPEPVFSVIGLNLCRHGPDHKLRQITNCDDMDSWIVAICDCRNLWQFKMQLLRLLSIVPEGILLSAENVFTSTSDPIKKVSFVHR